jgi:hypothetical protein
MGTRSTTKVYEYSGKLTPAVKRKLKPLLSLYRQMDGYPSGHGRDLADFLSDMVVVNGFGMDTPTKAANGAGCLAAQLVCVLKSGIGGIYVTTPDDTQSYDYKIYVTSEEVPHQIFVEVFQYKKKIFEGDVADFIQFCALAD